MKKYFILLAFLSIFHFAQAQVFTVDTSHSTVGFSAEHLVISKVSGSFADFSGSANFNPETKKLKSITAVIQTKSINTNNEKRDNHLKDSDFFDSEKFPTIEFKSKKINRRKDKYTIVGDITIKDITQEITLKGELRGIINDPKFGQRVGFSGEGKIANRMDFGLQWNALMESGGLVVGKEITLVIDVEMIKK